MIDVEAVALLVVFAVVFADLVWLRPRRHAREYWRGYNAGVAWAANQVERDNAVRMYWRNGAKPKDRVWS